MELTSPKLESDEKDKKKSGSSASKAKHAESKIIIKIGHLNEEVPTYESQITKKETAAQLFDEYCNHLIQNCKQENGISEDLTFERDYFGLKYSDSNRKLHWLELGKSVYTQLHEAQKSSKHTGLPNQYRVTFRMKHYPPSLSDLKHTFTRSLFYLQIRRDLIQGRLLCRNADDNINVASLILQIEEGDFSAERETSEYNEKKMFLYPQPHLEKQIISEYKKNSGMTANKAAEQLLELVTELPTYGIDPYQVWPQFVVEHKSGQIGATGSQTHLATDSSLLEVSNNVKAQIKKSNTFSNGAAGSSRPIKLKKPQAVTSAEPEKNYYLGIGYDGMKLFVGTEENKVFRWGEIEKMTFDGKVFRISTVMKKGITKKVYKYDFQMVDKSSALSIWRWANDRMCFFKHESSLDSAEKAKPIKSSTSMFKRSKSFKFSGNSHAELKSKTDETQTPERSNIAFRSMRIVLPSGVKPDLNNLSQTMKMTPATTRPMLGGMVYEPQTPIQQASLGDQATPKEDFTSNPLAEDGATNEQAGKTDSILEESIHLTETHTVTSQPPKLEAGDGFDMKHGTSNGSLVANGCVNSGYSHQNGHAGEETSISESSSHRVLVIVSLALLGVFMALAVYVLEARGQVLSSDGAMVKLAKQLRQQAPVDYMARAVYEPVRGLVLGARPKLN